MADFHTIPSIERLRQRPAVRGLESAFGNEATTEALRAAAADVRAAMASGTSTLESEAAVSAWIEQAARTRLGERFEPTMTPVINATGVIVHTNLGRAPLAPAAVNRMGEVARGYAALEYDIGRGARGRRDMHAEPLLCALTGAEAAVVVNNNAAATWLILAALGSGREIIVSRGELVEIGGGFRIPDVMAQSGAQLREVGTTNKTRTADYAAAISERTALLLRVHPSNFRIEGFTERPSLGDMVALGRRYTIPIVEDLGSGLLHRSAVLPDEPAVQDSVTAGVDVCCFSGDKLLGGPQAGIIVGRAELLDRIRQHPLMRALRVDKITYAALDATLVEYASGRAPTTVPVQRMLQMDSASIRSRAEALAGALRSSGNWTAEVVESASAVGGGSAPGVRLPTWLVAIERRGMGADALQERLRHLMPPVIARVERDRVVLDLRTVLPEQDEVLEKAVRLIPAG